METRLLFRRIFKSFLIAVITASGMLTNALALPVASFTANHTTGCTPLNVQFTSTSTGATSFYWDLGNGNTSTLQNPSNLYTTPGTYTVRLIAYDGNGNTDTSVQVNYITVIGKPAAGFQTNITAACPDNNSFTFTNQSTGATSYLWDFGDGSTSTAANPVYSYANSGTYTVTLIATNAFGCQDVYIRNTYITIYPKPDGSISAATTASCDPSTVFQFNNSGSNVSTWAWNFGDGTTSTLQNPSHSYSSPGSYPVSLLVTNSYGCSDTSDLPAQINVGISDWADFYVNTDSGCAPLGINFTNSNANIQLSLWNFGDGSTTTVFSPSHTYSAPGLYTVSLIVTTNTGCTDTVTKTNFINVGVKPDVSFTYSATGGCSPHTVQFTNTSTNFTSCQWWFGDGNTSTATNPIHTYTSSGTFDVTLKCWGPTGCVKTVVYHDIINVTSPVAIFNASPRVGCPPLNTTFNALSPATGLTYHWDFGDGSTSSQPNPSHTYNGSGNYDVTLIVTDSLGCSDTLVKNDYIQTVNPAASYIPPPTTTGCAPLSTQFTDATAGATSWLWDFGDGTTSTLQNPAHTYTTPGFYTVSLTTESAGGGCTQTISTFSSFQVNGGAAGFTHTTTQCPPYIATFQDTSTNAVSWLWDFGDGTTSTAQNPSHTFLTPGYHSVSLTITTADGCTYTTMQSNGVYFSPFGANFYGVPLDTVFPVPVQWYANSVGATSWLWDFGDGTTSTQQDPLHVYQNPGNYNVTLQITNGLCTLFYDPPPFDFGTPDSTPVSTGNQGEPEIQRGCAPLHVLFTNRVQGAASWLWDFGDGSTSTLPLPGHTYTTPGVFSVTLTTVDTLGISQTLVMDSIVYVYGPRAGFTISQTASCSNTNVQFTDTSSNAMFWQWNFGDGNTSTQQSPSHTYTTGMPNYIITQTVSDTMGCSSSISTSIFSNFVSPLLASESEVCGADPVHFFTSLQNYASYMWDFGDGTTSSSMNPSHIYLNEGTFDVSLTVTDIAGCVQTFYLTPSIKVSLPQAAFATSSPRQGCNRLHVNFANYSVNADSWFWEFGDGNTSSLENPTHSFDPGVYDVTLTVYRGSCVSQVHYPQYIKVDTAFADFSMTTNQICLPVTATFTDLSVNPVSWFWDFGDGDTSTVQNPVHVYPVRGSRYPKLIMTDINGCTDTISKPYFAVLRADFESSVQAGCFPLEVSFTDKSTMATNWNWDFGDGNTSTVQSPSHTYTQPGTYNVTLVVSSVWAQCTDTLTMQALIEVKQPKADFHTPDVYACAPSLVNFTNLSSDADTYLWDFGDGTTSTNQNPSHIYNTPGIYTVKLVVASTLGCSDSLTKYQYIQVLGPLTDFTASAFEGCAPFSVEFTDRSQNAVGWSWNFGDGYSSMDQNPVHVFADTGIFTVTLVTTDTAGCSSFYELPQKIIIHATPVAEFNIPVVSGCEPFDVAFQNHSTGHHNSYWYFGDGATSTDENPLHTYATAGDYTATLIASNNFGCADTFVMSQPLTVLPRPVVSFTSNENTGCVPFNVFFSDLSTNIVGPSYSWDFGNGQTSTDPNPVVQYTSPGFYTVTLTVTNANGCSSSSTFPAMIHVLDTIPPPESKLYSVSVMSNSTVEIIWENNPALDLAAYIVYRKSLTTNQYMVVHTKTDVQNTFDLTSSYTDTGLSTLTNTYTYKVQAVDVCGNAIPLDQLTAHTTINVSSQRSGDDILVTWTPYGGATVGSYKLYRCEDGQSFQYLTTVYPWTFSYVDSGFTCPYPYSYKIVATDLDATFYTSNSDTSRTIPKNIFIGQIADIVRSTVVDNYSVLTEWSPPHVHPEMISHFELYRSTDSINYSHIATIPATQNEFMDYNVDVQSYHYYYKILVHNTCDIYEDLSPSTSTIIIRGEMNDARQVHLEWTPYIGWDSGVDYYLLEKRDENGNWQVLRQLPADTRWYDYQE